MSNKQPFNKDQRKGLAKVADNLATALMVATIIGGVIQKQMGGWAIAGLVLMFFMLLYVAYSFRKEQGDENDD